MPAIINGLPCLSKQKSVYGFIFGFHIRIFAVSKCLKWIILDICGTELITDPVMEVITMKEVDYFICLLYHPFFSPKIHLEEKVNAYRQSPR